MDIKQQIFAFLAGVILLALIFRLLKNERLHPSFAALWIGMAAFMLSISLFGEMYRWLAHSVLGVSGGDHVIYISCIAFLLMYVFYLTGKMCRMIDQITKLISTVAMLEARQQETDRKLVNETVTPRDTI